MAAVLEVETLHMVPGDGDTSYARNSTFQSGLQSKLKPMIEEAVASLLNDNGATADAYCGSMAIADLGCSSGPNTLALVSTAVDAFRCRCSELQQQPRELCIHLNDLPSNDFNLVIRSRDSDKKITSGLQSKLKPMIEEAVASLLNDNGATADAYCGGMAIADLGCSSGPNTLALVSTAVGAVRRRCSELQQQPRELCIHLNDLPSNDFNPVIRSLATYIKTQESFSPPVLTSIVPGSFHGRLFNKSSLHLVCSTASLHWLSKAPEDLVRNGIPFYDRDEAVRRARRSTVIKAYARQFNDDFTRILHMRAQEMVPRGRMVFSLLGQSVILFLEFTNAILHEMASKGLIDNEKLDSFYIPLYASEKELREIIEAEGSFSIDKMAIHEYLDQNVILAPKTIARALRAIMEPIIAQHFRPSADVMDEFLRITKKFIKMSPLDEFPSKSGAFVAASLTRRT